MARFLEKGGCMKETLAMSLSQEMCRKQEFENLNRALWSLPGLQGQILGVGDQQGIEALGNPQDSQVGTLQG